MHSIHSEVTSSVPGGHRGAPLSLRRAAVHVHRQLRIARLHLHPSIPIYVQCADEAEFDRLYSELSKDGKELMPLSNYGFSTKFDWVNDRFGVSWQLKLA